MDYSKELTPDVREKMKKNLVYVGIISIVMVFAGLTSAYYVNMGGGFWFKYPMPTAFYTSSVAIVLSSITFALAIWGAKQGKNNLIKIFMGLTFCLGIAFVILQWKGFQQLIDKGIYPVNKEIIITEGRYGSYYEIKYKGAFIQVDGNDYKIKNRKMTKTEFISLQNYMRPYISLRQGEHLNATKNPSFEIILRNQPVIIKENAFYLNDSTTLDFIDELRLSQLARNINLGRGDFVSKGSYGKDFVLYYKGQKLDYKNRELQYKGKKLHPYLQIKAAETTDNASAFLYILVGLHLLHILAAILYLLKLLIGSFSNKYSQSDHLALKVGSIFWHFLGGLWFYLLVFLVFIH